jgi:DNA modification methylase
VAVFREARRVLRDDGTLWVVAGDCYAGSGKGGQSPTMRSEGWQPVYANHGKAYGLKRKDLIGIPWMLAFALRADGWILRQEIIWHKPNAMPESVKDRCTRAHEQIFMLAKSARYYYDADAVREPAANGDPGPPRGSLGAARASQGRRGEGQPCGEPASTRNRRSVWTVPARPGGGALCPVYPARLVEPCVYAGSRPGGLVIDPFCGSGSTGAAALGAGRRFIGIDISPESCELAAMRLKDAVRQVG